MRFEDPRTEWRIDAIERQLQQKLESHQLDSLRSDVDRLEYSLREACTTIAELRFELSQLQEDVRRMRDE